MTAVEAVIDTFYVWSDVGLKYALQILYKSLVDHFVSKIYYLTVNLTRLYVFRDNR